MIKTEKARIKKCFRFPESVKNIFLFIYEIEITVLEIRACEKNTLYSNGA